MKLKTLRRLIQVSLLMTLPLISQIAFAAPASTSKFITGGAVAAEVNGDKIYKADLDRTMAMVKDREPAFTSNTPEAQKSLASLRSSILDKFIERLILTQEARRRNIVPVKADVDKALAEYQANYANEEAFKKALAEEGKTPDDVRRTLNEELALRELTAQMTADIKVTDADVQAYYKAHPNEFRIPEMARARHILVAYPQKATTAQKKEARTKAEGLLKKATVKGADFGQLARENSDDAGTKDVGGDLDFVTRGTFVKPFEDAIFDSPVGLVNRLIESEFGLHIVRVEQKEPSRLMKFEEIKGDPQLRLDIRRDKIKDRIDKELAALQAKAVIKKY